MALALALGSKRAAAPSQVLRVLNTAAARSSSGHRAVCAVATATPHAPGWCGAVAWRAPSTLAQLQPSTQRRALASRPDRDNTTSATLSDSKSLPYTERLRRAFKRYGAAGVAVYATISVADLVGLMLAAHFGVEMDSVLATVGVDPTQLAQSSKFLASSSAYAPYLVAYGVHKVLLPVRVMATIAITPKLLDALEARGIVSRKPRQ